MRVRREVLVVLCIGVAFSVAHLARTQEAASANLPDQFQTGEMASTSKPKKKKTESSSQTLATAIAVSRDSEVQKILNRRINSCRASIACSGFIRLSIFSRRSRSIAASSRTSWLRAFHFAYLAEPIPRASRSERIQTVMSVVVTRSIRIETLDENLRNTFSVCKRPTESI